jgi:transcriptional regulator with XRE-family HTH domain
MWQLKRPAEALEQLGARLKDQRIAQSLTQAQLAKLAGVGVRSVSRLEETGTGRTDTLLRVLTALNIVDRLDTLLPEATPSPLAMLSEDGRQKPRLRVRHKKAR